MEVASGLDIGSCCFGVAAFADCAIVVAGATFPAHCIIITRLSAYFERYFRFSPALREVRLECPGDSAKYFSLCLRYLYGGSVALNEANAVGILLLSDYLQIGSLYNQALTFISTVVMHDVTALISMMCAACDAGEDTVLDICLTAAVGPCWAGIVSLARAAAPTGRGGSDGGEGAAAPETTAAVGDRNAARALLRRLPLQCARLLILQRAVSIQQTLAVPYFTYNSPATHRRAALGAASAAVAGAVADRLAQTGASRGDAAFHRAMGGRLGGAASSLQSAEDYEAGWRRRVLGTLMRTSHDYGGRRALQQQGQGQRAARGLPAAASAQPSELGQEPAPQQPLWLASASAAGEEVARRMRRRARSQRAASHEGRRSEPATARDGGTSDGGGSPDSGESSGSQGGSDSAAVPGRAAASASGDPARLLAAAPSGAAWRGRRAADFTRELAALRSELSELVDAVLEAQGGIAEGAPAGGSVTDTVQQEAQRVLEVLEILSEVGAMAEVAPVLRGSSVWRLHAAEVLSEQALQAAAPPPPRVLHFDAESGGGTGTFLRAVATGFGSAPVREAVLRCWRPPLWEPFAESGGELQLLGQAAAPGPRVRPTAHPLFTGPHIPAAARVDEAEAAAGEQPPAWGGIESSLMSSLPAGLQPSSVAVRTGFPLGSSPLHRLADGEGTAEMPATAAAPIVAPLPPPLDLSPSAAAAAAGHSPEAARGAALPHPAPSLLHSLSHEGALSALQRRALRGSTLLLFEADELAVASEDEAVAFVMDILCGLWWTTGAVGAAAGTVASPGVSGALLAAPPVGAPHPQHSIDPTPRGDDAAIAAAAAASPPAPWLLSLLAHYATLRQLTARLWGAVRWEHTTDAALTACISAVHHLRAGLGAFHASLRALGVGTAAGDHQSALGIGVDDHALHEAYRRRRLSALLTSPAAAAEAGLRPPRFSYTWSSSRRGRFLLPSPPANDASAAAAPGGGAPPQARRTAAVPRRGAGMRGGRVVFGEHAVHFLQDVQHALLLDGAASESGAAQLLQLPGAPLEEGGGAAAEGGAGTGTGAVLTSAHPHGAVLAALRSGASPAAVAHLVRVRRRQRHRRRQRRSGPPSDVEATASEARVGEETVGLPRGGIRAVALAGSAAPARGGAAPDALPVPAPAPDMTAVRVTRGAGSPSGSSSGEEEDGPLALAVMTPLLLPFSAELPSDLAEEFALSRAASRVPVARRRGAAGRPAASAGSGYTPPVLLLTHTPHKATAAALHPAPVQAAAAPDALLPGPPAPAEPADGAQHAGSAANGGGTHSAPVDGTDGGASVAADGLLPVANACADGAVAVAPPAAALSLHPWPPRREVYAGVFPEVSAVAVGHGENGTGSPPAAAPSSVLPRLVRSAGAIFEAYGDIFNHLAVRRGWRKLNFTRSDVEQPLRAAAQVVALLRYMADVHWRPGFKIRKMDGEAIEFLWGVPPPPPDETHDGRSGGEAAAAQRAWKRSVFEGVVLASCRDAHGFVDGLTSQLIGEALAAHPYWQDG